MNKNDAAEFLPLVQALADGKVIQIQTQDESWADMNQDSITFGFYAAYHYRIKPEPLELVAVYNTEGVLMTSGNQKAVASWLWRNSSRRHVFTTKKFVEVT